MGKKLYVGNLSYDVTSSDLEQMFASHGSVQSAEVIQDRMTGRSKGFGFVEMGSDDEAQAAISAIRPSSMTPGPLGIDETSPSAEAPAETARRASARLEMQQIFTRGARNSP